MFTVKVASSGKIQEYKAEMLLVNTSEGMIGIKSNHENLITHLVAGLIKIFNAESSDIISLEIDSGLLQFINNDNCCIITITE